MDAKLTTLSQSGNDISTFGLSDIFVNGNYKLGQKGLFTLGAKIPLSDANKMQDGLSLPIYHLSNDKFTDIDGIVQEIEGSEGLTLNWNVYFDYSIKDNQNLQLILGAPFIVRDARPDGLTRSFIASVDYRISF